MSQSPRTTTSPASAAGADPAGSQPGGWHRPRLGLVIGGLTVAFLLFDAVIHLLLIQPVVDSFSQLGYPLGVVRAIAVLELLCLALYLIPRTSVLGAVLLTGYLGGAVSAQLRVGSPLVSTTLFAVYVGIALWAALFLRDARLRQLFPVRRR
jgi:hypothetical protein